MAAAAKAALEPWQTAAPRKRSATRRPQRRELEARGHETEPEADTKIVLRRLQEADFKISQRLPASSTPKYGMVTPALSGEEPGTLHADLCTDLSGTPMNDLLISAFWSSAVESISRCLTEQLGQQKPPVKTLSEAFGNLHLDSPLGESDVAHASSPGEPLVSGTCRVKCVCYGIGNFATCITARTQLAFLLLFLDKCQTPRSHCWVYDPLFSPLEIAVLHTLGVTVLSENEEGKRSVCGEPTIFYMLHCGTALYNNLLWSNWSVDALSRMVIIGNSFRGLEERLLTRILQKNYPYIAKILEGLDEVEFPQTSEYMDTFNDTSVHWFPTQKLERLPRDLWMFQEEPDYQGCEDLEIIRKTTDPPTADMNPV